MLITDVAPKIQRRISPISSGVKNIPRRSVVTPNVKRENIVIPRSGMSDTI